MAQPGSRSTPHNEVRVAWREGFPDTPEGNQQRFTAEFDAAEKEVKDWRDAGDTVIKQYLDDRKNNPNGDTGAKSTRLNFYWTNVRFVRAAVFAKVPKASVDRMHGDPNDDIARIGGQILERQINAGFEQDDDADRLAFLDALADYQMPGLAFVKLRYSFDTKQNPGQPPRRRTA